MERDEMIAGQITSKSALALLATDGARSLMRGYVDGIITPRVLKKTRRRLAESDTATTAEAQVFCDWYDRRFDDRARRGYVGQTLLRKVGRRTSRLAPPYATVPLHTLTIAGDDVAITFEEARIILTKQAYSGFPQAHPAT